MPVVVAGALASGAIAGIGASIAGTAIFSAVATSFIGSLVLGGLSMALTPKPKKQNPSSVSQISSSTYTIRQPDSTRKHVYGMTRFTDVFAQVVSTGVNGKIHAVVILCDDEIESIDEVWVNDYPISPDHLDADGNVSSGRYSGKLRIRKHLGSRNQAADPFMVAEVPEWTTSHRLRGIAYLYVTLTKDQDIYPNGMPNFSCIGKGRKIYDPRTGVTRWTPNCSLFAYDYLAQAEFGYEAEEDDINLTNIASAANIADEIVDTVALDMTVASVDAVAEIIALSGDRLLFELGDRVELVTAGTPPGGLATATDYYVIPYQIKATPRIKIAASLDDAIVGTSIAMSTAGSGSMIFRKTGEPRYHGAGVVDTADSLEDNLNQMLSAIAGRAVNTGGAWRLLPGAWQEPVLELGIDDFRGGMTTRTKTPMSERFNTISGIFVSQINDYQRSDYPSYRSATFIEEDAGREYPRDLPLAFTTRPTTAKRIAKLEALRARQEIVHSVPCSMIAMQAQAGDNVMVTIERRGWTQKIFEMTQFGFSAGGSGDNVELLTNVTLRETAEAIYDWASATDDPDFDLAPNTELPSAFDVTVPTGVAFSSRVVDTAEMDQVFTLVLNWDPHPNAFVTENGFMEIQFKLSSEAEWRPSFRVPGILVFSDVLVSSVNTAYDLRIRAVNNLGVRSGWTTLEDATVGSSGGVGATNDWGGANESVGSSLELDWGGVNESVGSSLENDWGSVV